MEQKQQKNRHEKRRNAFIADFLLISCFAMRSKCFATRAPRQVIDFCAYFFLQLRCCRERDRMNESVYLDVTQKTTKWYRRHLTWWILCNNGNCYLKGHLGINELVWFSGRINLSLIMADFGSLWRFRKFLIWGSCGVLMLAACYLLIYPGCGNLKCDVYFLIPWNWLSIE